MPTRVPNIGRTIRNIRRAREILTVFARYGFNDAIQEYDLDVLFQRGKRLVGLARPDDTVTREPQEVRLRRAMEELGPTFVKMAQILSTRPDLIPESWARELTKLQHAVATVPDAEMRAHIEGLFDEPVEERFASFDFEPLASASVAQAHLATLKDGTRVLLKILRPGIRDVIEADTEILRTLAGFMEDRFGELGYSPLEVVEQFDRQIRRETDLTLELTNISKMDALFADDPEVRIPKVYPEYSNASVMCMEHVEGVLLSHANEADLSAEERREIVRIGSSAVFRQCFEFGFFHADPHPGNIFAIRGGASSGSDLAATDAPPIQLCFIDFGMVGHIDPRTAERLADLVHGTVTGDLERVTEVVVDLTDMPPKDAGSRAFRADTWEFIARFRSGSLSDLQMGRLLSEFFAKLRKHRVRCPADLVYLIKAITTIEGVGEAIDPGFDIVGHVRPHVERLVRKRYSIGSIRRRLRNTSLAYAEMVERTPAAARDIVNLLRTEQLAVNLKLRGLEEVTREVEHASRNIAAALLIASLVVAGSILVLANNVAGPGVGLFTALGVIAFGFAGAIAAARMFLSR